MIHYKFREEKSSLGKILRPVADVILEKDGLRIETPMYIDSGADISMIPLRFGRALGFTQTATDVICELRGVSGAGLPYILKEVTFLLNGKRLNVKIAWALMEEVPILLGRMDIFNHFRVIFDEKKERIDLE
jgi:hypothetical protein